MQNQMRKARVQICNGSQTRIHEGTHSKCVRKPQGRLPPGWIDQNSVAKLLVLHENGKTMCHLHCSGAFGPDSKGNNSTKAELSKLSPDRNGHPLWGPIPFVWVHPPNPRGNHWVPLNNRHVSPKSLKKNRLFLGDSPKAAKQFNSLD